MTSAKTVIMTAIKFNGVSEVRSNAQSLADDLFCSKAHVMNLCKMVETGKIVIGV